MNHLNNPHINDVPDNGGGKKLFPKIRGLIKGLFYIRVSRKNIIGISNANFEHNYKGEWKNILHGYYYDLYPKDFMMIETWDSSYGWKSFDNYNCFSTIIIYFVALSDFIAYTINKFKKESNNDFEYISALYPIITKERLSIDNYFVKIFSWFINCFFNITRPRVLLLASGSYGGVAGVICKIAKSKGITVIDTQHGQVYQHKAYSASKVVKESEEYLEYLPDYFYSFGEYWSSCVDWQYKKVAVGNPYLNEFVDLFSGIEKTIDYLVISQPHGKNLQHQFIKALAIEYPSSKIVVRLHPSESLEREENEFENEKNVEVVTSLRNLYFEMCSSKYVIGWCSTCLTELLAFGTQPIIVRDSLSIGCFPEELGIWIETPKDIGNIDNNRVIIDNIEDYWCRDFKRIIKTEFDNLISLT